MTKLREWYYFKRNGLAYKARALRNRYFFHQNDLIIGKNVIIRKGSGHHSFGKKNIILDNCVFEVHNQSASISTGEECIFAYGTVMVCAQRIELGHHVWIGEYSSLRDSTHVFSSTHLLGSVPDITAPIKIGNNVWIGRGSIIMPGVVIEDNVIIAANSVVKGHCETNSVYGGAPAKFIKKTNS